jgi:hypothetical protein
LGTHINEQLSEAITVLAQIPPGSQAAGTVTLGPFSMKGIGRVLATLQIATLSGGSTVAAIWQTSATSGGSYTSVSGSGITTVTSGTNPVVKTELQASTLQSNSVGPWVQLLVTVATASATISALAIGGATAYDPASDNDIAAVVQTVVN